MAAGREDDRIGQVDGPITGVQVKRDRAEARAVCHQQPRDVLILLDLDAELGALARDRAEDGPPGEVAGLTSPPPAVGAKVALVEPSIRRARELATPRRELKDSIRGLPGHRFDPLRIAEQIALAHGIREVLLP